MKIMDNNRYSDRFYCTDEKKKSVNEKRRKRALIEIS
jgi:hypothetical protein